MTRHSKPSVGAISTVLILSGACLCAGDPATVGSGRAAKLSISPAPAASAAGGQKPALFTQADRLRMRLRTALFTEADQKQKVVRTTLFTEADQKRMTVRSAAWTSQGAKVEFIPSPAVAGKGR